jgi:hypothetical protein
MLLSTARPMCAENPLTTVLGLVVAAIIHFLVSIGTGESVAQAIPTGPGFSRLDERKASDSLLEGVTGLDENAARRGELDEAAIVDEEEDGVGHLANEFEKKAQ